LTSQKASPPEEIKTQFLDLIKRRGKPYGIVIRRLGDPAFQVDSSRIIFGPSQREEKVEPAILAYRVYPDGREELIRNANLAGISQSSFKDILAVSNTRTVYSAPFTTRNASPFGFNPFSSSATTVVSYVVPSSLLFEDITVQKPSGEIPKPPASGHPFFGK
jgi:hypothetical protein